MCEGNHTWLPYWCNENWVCASYRGGQSSEYTNTSPNPKTNGVICSGYNRPAPQNGPQSREYSKSCYWHRTRNDKYTIHDLNFTVGKTITALQINQLRDLIDNEIDQKNKHQIYVKKSMDKTKFDKYQMFINGVKVGNVIDTTEPNAMNAVLSSLNAFISNMGAAIKDVDNYYLKEQNYTDVIQGNIISAENIKPILSGIQAAIKDCICYSDCNSFQVCNCYGYCNCNYY